MTQQEHDAIIAATKIVAKESFEAGVLNAVEMIRITSVIQPNMSLTELTRRIETTVETTADTNS